MRGPSVPGHASALAAAPPHPAERHPGDAAPRGSRLPRTSSGEAILAHAEMLGIPWRRLLEAEVEAELALRRCEVEIATDDDLALALCILSRSALQTWRVRDRVEALCGAAAVSGSQVPLRRLIGFVRGLAGGSEPDRSLRLARRSHCRQAYRRIRELVALVRSAAREGTTDRAEDVRRLVERTRCSLPDAEWAMSTASAADAPTPLEASVRRARADGFQIPIAGSDRAAYRILRDWVAASRPRRVHRGRPARAKSERIRLASSAVETGSLDAHSDS